VWIEILGSGPRLQACQKEYESASEIIVPTIVLYEVYKKISEIVSEDQALSAIAMMSQHKVLDLSQNVALTAADISKEYKLPMADSFVLAHAKILCARLVTLDNDFAGIDGVGVIH